MQGRSSLPSRTVPAWGRSVTTERPPNDRIAHQRPQCQRTAWHKGFLEMLPAIERNTRIAFRHLPGEAKDDAICEVIANCVCATAVSVERRELHRAFPSVWYGTRSHSITAAVVWERRSVPTICIPPVLGKKPALKFVRLARPVTSALNGWRCLIDSRRMPVPDQANFRIEFPRWLSTQTKRNRANCRMAITWLLDQRSRPSVQDLTGSHLADPARTLRILEPVQR